MVLPHPGPLPKEREWQTSLMSSPIVHVVNTALRIRENQEAFLPLPGERAGVRENNGHFLNGLFRSLRCNFLILASFFTVSVTAVTYEVGPGKNFSAISEVPWERLEPGDVISVYWRPTPYKEKFVVCRQGTASAPIIIRGIPDAKGDLPIIDGEDATTRSQLDFWNDVRGIIKIGGAKVPADTMPRHIVIENLEIRGARPPFSFKSAKGETKNYKPNAAAIYVEKAEDLTIRHCIIRDSGNGIFISSNDNQASTNILIESNHIYDNGNVKSGYEHNVYSEAIGITFQSNHFGPLKTGSLGNNLKDRSAGTIIRYNWIEGGNNILDLVDAEDSALVRASKLYGHDFIYGNVMIKPNGTLHSFVTHYGGDSSKSGYYRNGILNFFNNTVITERKGGTQLFRLTSGEKVEAMNNIFYGPNVINFTVTDKGFVKLSHNWIGPKWRKCVNSKADCDVIEEKTLNGSSPGFVDVAAHDFHLSGQSPCVNVGVKVPFALSLEDEYVEPQKIRRRNNDGKPDLGAFEH
jgi:hypothetical protein